MYCLSKSLHNKIKVIYSRKRKRVLSVYKRCWPHLLYRRRGVARQHLPKTPEITSISVYTKVYGILQVISRVTIFHFYPGACCRR